MECESDPDNWNHDAFMYELNLQDLQALTEDPTLFRQVAMSSYVARVIKEIDTFSAQERSMLRCIEQYETSSSNSGPDRDVFLCSVTMQLKKIGLICGPGERWFCAINASLPGYGIKGSNPIAGLEANYSIADTFSLAIGEEGATNRLCYNHKCLRREHMANDSNNNMNARRVCPGPKWGRCQCRGPQCLLPGPHYIPNVLHLGTIYSPYTSIGIGRLSLSLLQRLTEDDRFFRQIGVTGHALTYANEQELIGLERTSLQCIEEFPRTPVPNEQAVRSDKIKFERREDPEREGDDMLSQVAKRLYWIGLRWEYVVGEPNSCYKWCYDGKSIQEIFATTANRGTEADTDTLKGRSIRTLCYNTNCLRRGHQYICRDHEYYRERHNCKGGALCTCEYLPRCLMRGIGGHAQHRNNSISNHAAVITGSTRNPSTMSTASRESY